MHINQGSRDRNVLAAWAIALSDVVRTAVEHATGMAGSGPAALVAIVADPGMSINELRRVLDLTHPGPCDSWIASSRKAGSSVSTAPVAQCFWRPHRWHNSRTPIGRSTGASCRRRSDCHART